MEHVRERKPAASAQGGQDDTNREQPKGDYQQNQGQETAKQDTKVQGEAQKLPPSASAQGGQDDTNREQPKGDYQQK
ncbi:MAG: hypothetical protein NVSMB49_03990 [Ktedonobacteraceae bacterium]